MNGPDMRDQARVSRLRWHSRRGMKELDVLLERFVYTHRQPLAAGRWPEFETLLELEDDLLWDWLQNPADEHAAPWRPLLERIRRG